MKLSFLIKIGFGTVILFLISITTKGAGMVNIFCWLLTIIFGCITGLLLYLRFGSFNDDNNQGDTE